MLEAGTEARAIFISEISLETCTVWRLGFIKEIMPEAYTEGRVVL